MAKVYVVVRFVVKTYNSDIFSVKVELKLIKVNLDDCSVMRGTLFNFIVFY